MTRPALLVFTDLDGTLLDDAYSHAAADEALAVLRERSIPLILTTSKTLAELEALRRELALPHPVIFENGCGVAVPTGYFEADGPAPGSAPAGLPLQIEISGPTYAELRSRIEALREREGFAFRGFGDMDAAEVAERTGLSPDAAALARTRSGSEPGVLDGDETEQRRFATALQRQGLRAVVGGRFLHVMPPADKATAMAGLVERYRSRWPGSARCVVAAGDSPNDALMLAEADVAVLVRRSDGSWLDLDGRGRVLRSTAVGPAGWQECMDQVLEGEERADDG